MRRCDASVRCGAAPAVRCGYARTYERTYERLWLLTREISLLSDAHEKRPDSAASELRPRRPRAPDVTE